jgi:glycosyltransferase involved in cell wall biosynthesis
MTTVTVIVSSRDRAERLAIALPAVLRAVGPDDEVIVVDSASTSPETGAVANAAGVRCLRSERPGLSRARNLGVRAARGDVVAFTDDDCEPAEDWVDRIRAHFADPRVAYVTGRVEARGEADQQASVLDHTQLVRYSGMVDPYGVGHGANMSYRRTALLELGLFDEELGSGAPLRSGEDADMLLRCMVAGHDGVYDPDVVVAHDQWRAPEEMVRLRYGYGLGNGAYRMKAVRRGEAGASLILRSLWHQGLRTIAWAIRRGGRDDVRGALSWTRGMLVGLVRGRRRALDGPNFRAPA